MKATAWWGRMLDRMAGRGAGREVRVIRGVTTVLCILLLCVTLGAPTSAPGSNEESTVDVTLDQAPVVRVWIRALGKGPWTVRADGGMTLLVRGETRRRAETFDVGWHAGAWRVNRTRFDAPEIRIVARKNSELEIQGRRFVGEVVFNRAKRTARAVLHVPLEEYVAQVLPAEMPLSYPDAALAAQAIATRTYAIVKTTIRRHADWDVADDETSQVFAARSQASVAAARMARETDSLVLTTDGAPFHTYFSSNCGGSTRGNDAAFNEAPLSVLSGRPCGHCEWARDFEWTHSVSVGTAAKKLKLGHPPSRAVVTSRGAAGYDARVLFVSRHGEKEVSARALRRALGYHKVKSTRILAASISGGRLTVKGRGFGHGVGMCQQGARGLAQSGASASEILAFYYQGAQTGRLVW